MLTTLKEVLADARKNGYAVPAFDCVEDVMVPRADITAVDHTITMAELMARFQQAGHSRLPVYQDTLDDPVGMVHIKDVMSWLTAVASKVPPRVPGKKAAQRGKSKQ